MIRSKKEEAVAIAQEAIRAVLPADAVRRELKKAESSGRVFLVSVGKAGWTMAKAAVESLEGKIANGVVITKYHHAEHPLPGVRIFEAGHPIPDSNSFLATQVVLDMTQNLSPDDTVLLLLSGGGSALFEKPLISGEELQEITDQMLCSGADIVEINTIRKRLSSVKAGRFAQHCFPAKIYALVLSDVLGDIPHMIASGPAVADPTTSEDAIRIVQKYNLHLSDAAWTCIKKETPKRVTNVQMKIIGSVTLLCQAAANACSQRGYEPILITDALSEEASTAGRMFGKLLADHAHTGKKVAFLAGGETVVHVRGNGTGGRNQELALAAAPFLDGLENVCLISVGSDGTDGPTDAAGGYVDGKTMQTLGESGGNYEALLANNDAYHALQKTNGLVFTGPTGTNVNDVVIGLVDNGG